MSNASMVAVGKLLGKELPELTAGKYEVDEVITLRVRASISKGVDYTVRPTTSMPWLAVVKYILHHACSGDANAAMELATEAVSYCLDSGNKAQAEELLGEVDEAIDRVVERALDGLPPAPRKGATTVKGEIEVLSEQGVL
jgi:hypothetical protein